MQVLALEEHLTSKETKTRSTGLALLVAVSFDEVAALNVIAVGIDWCIQLFVI